MDRWARLSVAAVWWYQGLICKILGLDGDQRAIVASLPWLPGAGLRPALVGIGVLELAIGAWVLSGARRYRAAVAQTVVLVAFNTGGLAFGGTHIADPGQLVTGNAALLALVWLLARRTLATPDGGASGVLHRAALPARHGGGR